MFNPNELVLEKIRAVEEYDPATNELTGRYTQIESPSLKTSADGTPVTDAMGSEITTFYNAQTGTFDFTNSLFSLDLAASQFGTQKEVASATNKIIMPVSETIPIASDGTVVLKYAPVGTAGAEVKYVKVINENNTFGKTYEVSATAGDGKFTLDVATKTITLPSGVTGRAFVRYDKETENAVKVSKNTDGVPAVKSLLIHGIFHDPCNTNLVYAGVISVARAQIDPSSVEINLTADGKHAASYKLQKPYCDEKARLFDIIISED
ncbi:hypothetical protein SAMN05443270_3020 [Lacrimispora sphenoides]|uniref:hypothetical protein n=1 Tax=Lacrimispora sphenoides TaxID=29370 RepID=UPI0008D6CE26|nr:hypothetical protein [Lacrimispora sphenoides]SEU08407.1 hypothetical protein SAMN05443270_3020 [Lacrimispora sphenoides]